MRKLRLFSTLIIITTLMVAFQNCGETKFRKNAQSSAAPEEIQTSSEAPITLLDQTVFEGQSVIFQAVLGQEAVNPSFTWSFDGNILETTSTPEFSIASTELDQQGVYTVSYFDGETQLGSAQASLTVIQQFFGEAPIFTHQPSGQSLQVGQKLILAVLATGNPTPTYQWLKNGTAINGATSSIFTINSVKLTDAGKYSAMAINDSGSLESNKVDVAVNTPAPPPPAPKKSCSSQYRIDGGGVSCAVSSSTHGNSSGRCTWNSNFEWTHGSCSYTCNNGNWVMNYHTCDGGNSG